MIVPGIFHRDVGKAKSFRRRRLPEYDPEYGIAGSLAIFWMNTTVISRDLFAVVQDRLSALVGAKSSTRGELARGGLGSVAVKCTAAALTLGLNVLLARVMGPSGYGQYAFVISITALLAVPSQLGLPTLVTRETARANEHLDWGLLRGLWSWTDRLVCLLSTTLVLIGLALIWIFEGRLTSIQLACGVFGLLSVPLTAFANLRGAAIRGLGRVVLGQLPELILTPGILAVILLGVAIAGSATPLSPARAIGLYCLTAGSVSMVAMAMLRHLNPARGINEVVRVYNGRLWTASTLQLGMMAAVQLVNQYTDVVTLGIFSTAENVGIYKAALSVSSLMSFGLAAINMMIAPSIVRMHIRTDLARLKKLMMWSARISTLVALPGLVVAILFGHEALAYIFGKQYAAGYWALVILSLGQLATSLTGSVGILLNMTGHEKDVLHAIAGAVAVNIGLCGVLIHYIGMDGAALSTSISLVFWNVLLWRSARKQLGINCTIMPIA